MTQFILTDEHYKRVPHDIPGCIRDGITLLEGGTTEWMDEWPDELRTPGWSPSWPTVPEGVIPMELYEGSMLIGGKWSPVDYATPEGAREILKRWQRFGAHEKHMTDYHLKPAFANFCARHSAAVTAYLRIQYDTIGQLITAGIPEAGAQIYLGDGLRATRVNLLNGAVLQLLAYRLLRESKKIVERNLTAEGDPIIDRIVLAEEFITGIVPGKVANGVAEHFGIKPLILWPPQEGPYTEVYADDDPTMRSLRFAYDNRTYSVLTRIIKDVAAIVWPGLKIVAERPDGSPWQFDGADVARDYQSAMIPPSMPATAGYGVRNLAGQLQAIGSGVQPGGGVQLGMALRPNNAPQKELHPCPPELYIASSLAVRVAGGDPKTGDIGWGIDCLWDPETKDWRPCGQATWEGIAELQEKWLRPHAELFNDWTPAPPRIAIYVDRDNEAAAWGQGCEKAYWADGNDRGWRRHNEPRNLWYACAYLGEPPKVVYKVPEPDDGIELLIVPGLHVCSEHTRQALFAAESNGVKVLHTEGAIISGPTFVNDFANFSHPLCRYPGDLAPEFRLRGGPETFAQFRDFVLRLADFIAIGCPFPVRWKRMPGDDPVLPFVGTALGEERLLLIGDHYEPGEVAAWWQSVGGGEGKFADKALRCRTWNRTRRGLWSVRGDPWLYEVGCHISIGSEVARLFTLEKENDMEGMKLEFPVRKDGSVWTLTPQDVDGSEGMTIKLPYRDVVLDVGYEEKATDGK